MENSWYIAAESQHVKASKPLAVEVLGQSVVLFRNRDGQAVALPDRCPHRNVKLSGGRVCQGQVRCPYHGWEFDASGRCVYIPSLLKGESIPPGAVLSPYHVQEQDGYVWLWCGERSPLPTETPFQLPHYQEPGWHHTRLSTVVHNSVENVIENFIDCPHTGYVHGGLFRTPASHLAKTRITRTPDGVTIDIDEETQTSSLLGRLLVRQGSQVQHQDRFILPATVQVSYQFGERAHILGYQICTPVQDFKTQVFVYVTWRLFGPLGALLSPLVHRIGRTVLQQDLGLLNQQGQMVQQYGEQFVSAPADTANLWIRAARRRAERGEPMPDERSKEVDFRL